MHHKDSNLGWWGFFFFKNSNNRPSWQERSSELLDQANCSAVWVPCATWVHPRPSQTVLEKKVFCLYVIYLLKVISVKFWVVHFLHKLALTFFLQDKATELEHITNQKMNHCCLMDVEWLSLGLHPVILTHRSPGHLTQVNNVVLLLANIWFCSQVAKFSKESSPQA